jgi:hypothetical protein
MGAASAVSRSTAVPFLPRPAALDGTMVGDCGFDPLGIASAESLPRLRAAELRHGRLAMVATWGWPVAELGFGIATRLVPPSTVCTGNGCAIDGPLGASALPLDAIRAASFGYWGLLLLAAVAGEVSASRRAALRDTRGSFDPLRLAESASLDERRRLELAEVKHGRLAMCALALVWGRKWAAEPAYTFAHQLWGDTCVFNLKAGGAGLCYQQTVPSFDFVLSWEIMYRVLTGFYSESYF